MDFTKALMFPFDDQDWLKKLGLGILVGLIPLVGPITLMGWSYEISKRVKADDPTPLPGWEDFGDHLRQGFMLFLANLIYQIPTLIVGCIIFFAGMLPALSGGDEDLLLAMSGVAGIVSICCSCIIFLYAIAAAVIFWGGYIRYIDNPEFGVFFQIGDNFALVKDNIGDFGMALLYTILAGAIASVATSITAGLGSLLVAPFTQYFTGHLLGQLAVKLEADEIPQV